MSFHLPDLPYAPDALEPSISARTLELHHGKHHAAYVRTLNEAMRGSEHEGKSLEELIATASKTWIYQNAAQAWNHEFYWSSMSPDGGGEPPPDVAALLRANFGSVETFRRHFTDRAKNHFGSGWAWLVWHGSTLVVETTRDADCPLRQHRDPLLACDLWEHAYYLDYQNERSLYLEAWWRIVNWNFVSENMRRTAKEMAVVGG